MTTEDYKILLPTLPTSPGVYRYINAEGTILYIGKAKNLKKRIASYFGNKKNQVYKTRIMIKNAERVEYTLVESENDALLLEATLIKKHQPRFNVMLKDGKSYTYLCIKKEAFPRVFLTRRVIKDGSNYFGPYTSKYRINIILDLIKQLFKLRTCTFNLSKKNVEKGSYKVCLEYHIKNCEGGCVGYESEENYNQKIEQIKNILRGHFKPVKEFLMEQIYFQAENLNFEMAQSLKEQLIAFENYQGKSTIVSTTITDVDIFTIEREDDIAYVNYLKIVNGALINSYTQELIMNLNQDEKDLLAFTIPLLRKKFNSIAPEIILPYEVAILEDEDIRITIPKIGDKKKLLELSQKNVHYFVLQKRKDAINNIKKQTSSERILRTLQSDLNMDEIPMHIECFDNSNIQGAFPVSSCVVFKNAKPAKRDYRHFNIKTVVGPDDFASMEEVVRRRYTRLVNENQPLPQLIIIDGGKGQLSSSVKILKELNILDKIVIIGIAKRLEEIFFPGDSVPIYINKKSESLKLIQQLRNEAHRFAITFHRNQRSKDFTTSELNGIKGIGEKTAEKLLAHFGSVKKIKALTLGDIEFVVGKSYGKKVFDYFANTSKTSDS